MLTRTPKIDWPPDYTNKFFDRQVRYLFLQKNPNDAVRAREFYKTRPVEFIEDWCDTFDPRNAGTDKPTRMPFVLFPRQREFIEFLHACLKAETSGLIEKSRDMGATWLAVSFSVWLFLFVDGATVGWGSRKASSVDFIGDMGSIFEKIRFQLRAIPQEFWPKNFGLDNMSYMRVHEAGGNSIIGECGDDIGRGGRTLIYFKDESAHYEHPESIEASLSENTRVQIDISSVNGLGNVFHRKRDSGVDWVGGAAVRNATNVFVMDWSDHPDKTQQWYDEREASATAAGLLHIFRQEVDRSYAAGVEGVVIPADWVKAAIDAHLQFPDMLKGSKHAALDVADSGGDRNALAVRQGCVLLALSEWGERDTGVTTRKAIGGVEAYAPINMQYDCIGVGAGVKAEANRLKDDGLMPRGIDLIAWDAGSGVMDPDRHVEDGDDQTPLNKDFYTNLKAQGWWQLRRRFERTYRALKEGVVFDSATMISLDSSMPLLRTLQKELSQPTASKGTRMRLLIDKQPPGTRSPNLADAVMMAFMPHDSTTFDYSWVG